MLYEEKGGGFRLDTDFENLITTGLSCEISFDSKNAILTLFSKQRNFQFNCLALMRDIELNYRDVSPSHIVQQWHNMSNWIKRFSQVIADCITVEEEPDNEDSLHFVITQLRKHFNLEISVIGFNSMVLIRSYDTQGIEVPKTIFEVDTAFRQMHTMLSDWLISIYTYYSY